MPIFRYPNVLRFLGGKLRIGAPSNYTQFDRDGELLLVGTATAWEDLRIAASSTSKGALRAPGFALFADNGAGSTGVWKDVFDKATEEEKHFEAQFPHRWLAGSTILPHVHWSPMDGGAGVVRWGLEMEWTNIGEVTTETTIIYINQATDEVAKKHMMTDPLGGGVVATGKEHSSMISCRIFRDATHEDDTYDNDAALREIDFHYEVSSFGEDNFD